MHSGDVSNSVQWFWWFSNPNYPNTVQDCMLVVNFGDAPTSFILGEDERIVGMDKGVSAATRSFILDSFYVDDVATLSLDISKLEGIAKELFGEF